MAKKLIVGNWKMYFSTGQSSLYLHKLQTTTPSYRDVEVVLCPNMLALQSLSLQINHRKFRLGAQNCNSHDEGAFTGEVSAAMLRGSVHYVIVGHSERRYIFAETNKDIALKVQAVLRNNMNPILCVGETKHERSDGETAHVIHDQVTAGLANVTSEEIGNVVIAYEPVWAIGTGEYARVDDAVDAANLIRRHVGALYGAKAAAAVRVLYGGSVDSQNARGFVQADGVDGLLVGGASLKAKVFGAIIDSGHQENKKVQNKG
jgi:triosephosphate isomerase (TIM)